MSTERPRHGTDISDRTDMSAGTEVVSARQRFRAWRRARPFWGGLLVILAGLELFFSGQLDLGNLHVQVGVAGMQATIIPIVLVLLGVLLWTMPVHRVFYGVIAMVLAVYSIVGVNLGGFLVGMLLGVVGGVVAVSWMPRRAADHEAETAQELAPVVLVTEPSPAEEEPGGVDVLFPPSVPELEAASRAEPAEPAERAEPENVDTAPVPVRPYTSASRRTNAWGAVAVVAGLATGFGGIGAPAVAGLGALHTDGGLLCTIVGPLCPDAKDDGADGSATDGPSSGTESPADPAATDAPEATDAPTGAATDDPPGEGAEGDAPAASDEPAGTPGSDATDDGTEDADGDAKEPSPSTAPTVAPSATPTDEPTPTPSAEATPAPEVEATDAMPSPQLGGGTLTGDALKLTSSFYAGNTTLTRQDGSTVEVMTFTAKKVEVPGFSLDAADAQGHGVLTTASDMSIDGDVVLYCTKLAGRLLGIPVSYTPDSPPPSIIPLPSLTDPEIALVSNTGGTLSLAGFHQQLH